MKHLANIALAFVAISHIGFMILEMFLWNTPTGQEIFGMTPEVSASSAVLAANQGLYNGFLAAGLFWALFSKRQDLKYFFLGCVLLAGIFGGLTASTSILTTQALPALLAIILVWFSRNKA